MADSQRGDPLHRSRYKASGSREFRSLLDLGTASVKVLVVELRGGQTHIWGRGQVSLDGGYGPAGDIVDREAVTAACDAALSAAESMTLDTFGHKIVPDRSVWSVPGWLCRGHTFAFQHRRSRPARRISQREWLAVQAQLEHAVADVPGTAVDVIPTIQVDGSIVTDAVDLRGETLSLRASVTSADSDALATFQGVAATLELEPPAFVSQARAATAGLPSDGVLLDVGRWGTNIIVARLGQLAGTAWMPMGGQSFYRTLLTSFELASARLTGFSQAYVEGWLPPEATMAADSVLVDPVARWLDLAAEQLADLATERSLPHRIYLAGEASRLPAVLQGTRRYAWMRQLPWSRHPEVHLWQPFSVSDLANHTGHVWGASDLVRLGLARLTADID
jgi:hypothetical protein